MALFGSLGLNTSAWNAGLRRAQSGLGFFQGQALRTAAAVGTLSNSLGRGTRMLHAFGMGAQGSARSVGMLSNSVYTLLPLLASAALGASTRWAIQFQQEMRSVMTIVRETEGTLSSLTDTTRKLSEAGGFDPIKTAKAVKVAISTNIDPREISKFMDEAMSLTRASGTDTDLVDVTRLMSGLKNAFELPMEALAPLRDVLFSAVDEGAVEMNHLAEGLGRIAPLARAAGMDLREMMAVIAAATVGGFTPEQAMTGLRNALSDILDPASNASKAMRDLKIDMSAGRISTKGFVDILEQLKAAAAKDPEAMGDVAEDIRSLSLFTALAGNQLDDYKRILDAVTNSTGKASEAAKMMAEGPMVKLEKIWAAIKNQAIQSAESVVQSLLEMLGATNSVRAAQMRMQASVKSIELAFRLVIQGVKEFVFWGLSGARMLISFWQEIWNLLKGIGNAISKFFLRGIALAATALADLAAALSFAAEAAGFDDTAEMFNNLSTSLRDFHDQARAGSAEASKDASENWDNMGESFTNTLTSISEMNKDWGIDAGREKIMSLTDEIRDLKETADLVEWAEVNLPGREKPQMKVEDAFGRKVDPAAQAAYERQVKLEELKAYLTQSMSELKRWHSDGNKLYDQQEAKFKKVLSTALTEYKHYIAELEKLDKARQEFNRNVGEKIFGIEQVDRSPRKQLDALKQRAVGIESMGNEALKQGNWEEAKRYVEEAMQAWQDVAELKPTKKARKFVVEQLKRLQEEMNAVFKKEEDANKKKRDEASAIMKEAQTILADLGAAQLHMEQSFLEITRMWEDVGRKTEEKMTEIADRLAQVLAERSLLIHLNTDPANKKLDELELRLKNLGVMGLEVSSPEVPGQAFGSPELPAPPRSDAAVGTNVDMGGITINYSSDGKNQKADARRLGREINRHIKRGQVAPLGGK